jgi:hypothetical protein
VPMKADAPIVLAGMHQGVAHKCTRQLPGRVERLADGGVDAPVASYGAT